MRNIVIGRGRDCDIRLKDKTDSVSRRQAVIKISLTGKMVIYDTSSNGTFVNGERIKKPLPHPLKKGDVVNFAHVEDLNWEEVHDPYKTIKIVLASTLILAVVAVAFVFAFIGKPNNEGSAISSSDLFSSVEAVELYKDTTAHIDIVTTPEISPVQTHKTDVPVPQKAKKSPAKKQLADKINATKNSQKPNDTPQAEILQNNGAGTDVTKDDLKDK